MGIIINDDFEIYHKYLWRCGLSERADENTARSYIRRYANTQVHTIFFNVNAQFSYSPSNVIETVESRYHRKEVDGVPFDFPSTLHKGWYDQLIVKKLDLWAIFTSEARAVGIAPGLSFRPNDTHDNLEPGGGLRQCDYTYSARKEGRSRVRHRAVSGYYDNCLDFGIREVRERFLAYIREQTLRYDVDVIEIDFMREPFLFRPGYEDEGREHVFAMMQKVRAITAEAAEKHGHAVKVALRTFRDPESDYYAGIDTPRLAREGLVDAVTVTARWTTTDSDVPLAHWRDVLPPSVSLSLGSEMLCRAANGIEKKSSEAFLRGLANYAFAAGADDFYMFNYSYLAHPTAEGLPELPEEQGYRDLLQQVGECGTLANLPQRYIVTYNDVTAYGMRKRPTLPLAVGTRHELSALRVFTGKTADKMYLLLDIDAEPDAFTVYMNSAEVKYIGKTRIEKEYAENAVFVYEVSSLRPVTQILEVGTVENAEATLRYVELRSECPDIFS